MGVPSVAARHIARRRRRPRGGYSPLTDPGLTFHWAAYAGDPAQPKPADGGTWSSWRAEGTETVPLVQATDTKQMTWEASNTTMGGLPAWVGDGVDDFAQTANFAGGIQTQAWVWVVVGCIAANGRHLVDGNDVIARGLFRRNLATGWEINNGSAVQVAGADADPHWFTGIAAGASSQIFVDGTSLVTGNAGSAGIDGVTLCANTAGNAVNAGPVSFVGLMTGAQFIGADFTRFQAWLNAHGIGV